MLLVFSILFFEFYSIFLKKRARKKKKNKEKYKKFSFSTFFIFIILPSSFSRQVPDDRGATLASR